MVLMYLLPGFFLASLAPSYIAPLNRRFDTILAWIASVIALFLCGWTLVRASIPLADVILVIVEALVFNVLMSRKRWT